MADISLRVTPEVLRQKSEEFSTIVRDIQKRFTRVENISAKTRGYWQGEAGTRNRSSYASYQEDIQFIIRRLSEHPVDLMKMAGVYIETEQAAVATSARLQTNQIV